jgi:hypothetical protein
MFPWFISLLFLFTHNGSARTVSSVGLSGSGNPHVVPADNPQPGPGEPADSPYRLRWCGGNWGSVA